MSSTTTTTTTTAAAAIASGPTAPVASPPAPTRPWIIAGPIQFAPSKAWRTKALEIFTTTLTPTDIPAGTDCMICLEPLALVAGGQTQEQAQVVQEEKAVKPVCGHAVHHHCMLRWSREKPECPYCRQALFFKRSKPNRDSLRKFVIPFEDGDYVVSENLWEEWANSCSSIEELTMVMGFDEFLDDDVCWRWLRGEGAWAVDDN